MGLDRYFMVLIVDFTAVEIVPGDARYRADQIIEQVKGLGAVEDVQLAGGVHEREED